MFVATYDAFSSTEVDHELKMAKELKKTIIPCKHTPVKWSRLEEIGIRTWDSF